jgi:hypothetical protein
MRRGRLPRRRFRLLKTGEPVVEDRGRPMRVYLCRSLSSVVCLLDCRSGQRRALGLVPPQRRQSKGGAGGDPAPGRRHHAVALGDERRGPREVADPGSCDAQLPEVKGQLRERAGVADELNVSRREFADPLDVPYQARRVRGDPAPSEDLVHREVG